MRMFLNEDLTLYENWSLTPPVLPQPSRLFSLEPTGIGTPLSESLTSYIARLAQAHHVSVAALYALEIRKIVDEMKQISRTRNTRTLQIPGADLPLLTQGANGTGKTARDLTYAIENLTLRKDISFLTMKPWSDVVSQSGLLRHTQAACFFCYEEWRTQGNIIYDPLLWALKPVVVCPKHLRPLSLHCRFCRRPLVPLASHSFPGHCSNCGKWLGAPVSDELSQKQPLAEAEWNQAIWVANAAGELIAAVPGLKSLPSREAVSQAISNQLDRFAGKAARMARYLRIRGGTVRQWQRGDRIPELGMLLQMCRGFETTLLQFLTGTRQGTEGPSLSSRARHAEIRRCSVSQPRPFNKEECCRAFQIALQEYPPPTLKVVAGRVNRWPTSLLDHFTDQYRIVVTRRAQYEKAVSEERWNALKPVLEAALNEDPPPLLEVLAKRLGCSPSSLRRHHRSLCLALHMRHDDHLKRAILSVRAELESALNHQSPPVSLKVLACRLGCHEDTLRRRFPDLATLLIRRFRDYRRANYLTRKQQLRIEMRRVALDLHRCGLYLSLERISSYMIPPRNLIGNKMANELLHSIREEIAVEDLAEK
jgi:hypothetical protein